jgi:quercetin dioxygenase-like cupin family protein
MSTAHARSGDLLQIEPDDTSGGLTGALALVRDERLEVMRWVLPAGRSVPEHLGYGPATIQCVRGSVTLRLDRGERLLRAGAIVYLAAGERHALAALADSLVLVTMVLVPPPGGLRELSTDGAALPVHGERAGGVADEK